MVKHFLAFCLLIDKLLKTFQILRESQGVRAALPDRLRVQIRTTITDFTFQVFSSCLDSGVMLGKQPKGDVW
jgi:hypothetical protein